MEQDLTKNVVKKQNRKITVFACLLSVISIGLLVFGFMAVSSNKVVMLQSISNLNNKLDPFLENNKVLLDKLANSKDVGLRTNIDVNVNELVAQDASFSINFDYLENRDDQKSKLNLEVTANNEELVKGQVALANQKVYGFINDITPKYYYTALEYTSLLSSLGSKDTEKIWSLLKDSVNDSINNDDIKKEKVTINYNGKDKKVNKLSYTITSKKVKAVLDKFFNSLKKEKTLFSNISKYALENSRVYIDIGIYGEDVNIAIKNISKDKLNISADELMQRFVRGESSRTTEGSGLGISIAQNLTTLQDGKFDLVLDGDLFKVRMSFKII